MDAPITLGLIVEAALDKKADRPEVLDLRGLCDFTDYFVVVSATSHRQVAAIVDGILSALHKASVRPGHVEGLEVAGWVLIDLGDIIVHVFLGEKRVFYDLEGLWRDAKRVPVAAPGPA